MNHILLDTFRKLTDTQKTELYRKYKDSGIGLKLFGFLTTVQANDFKTTEAVKHIYNGATEAYSVLENRYFKLRKKVLDDIKAFSKDEGLQLLAEEEAALNQCKYLISSGDKKEAYKRLNELERLCWERNIFELLPAILDNLIFCNQAFNELEKNKALYARMEEAIALQYDIGRVNILSRQIYDVFFMQGLAQARAQFNSLKELAEKNKKYPRFLMCYHYMSLYYKASAPEYFNNMQVVSRHHAEFKKLYTVHSHVPLMNYRANYAKHFHFHFNQITALFHNNRCEFEDAYLSVKRIWDLAQSSDSVYKQYKTESLYSNFFNVQVLTSRYRDAFETSNAYNSFLKSNKHFDRLPFANMLKAMLYINSWPQTFKLEPEYLHEQADEYIKQVKKQESIELTLVQALLIKAQLYIVQSNFDKANTLLKKPEVKKLLSELKIADLINELVEILGKGGAEKDKLSELNKKVQHRKLKASNSDEFREFYWMISHIGYRLKAAKQRE
ncbi:MAG TPA: hypothetical protein VK890_12485 [Bacteroidia bacterium]|jgi:hypothetical protein|nr:hypothetical protein [Bacteroidia bacterium]